MKKYYYSTVYYLKYLFCYFEIGTRRKSVAISERVCISLTSFGLRINYRLILVLRSLLNQSVNVEYICLSIDDKEEVPPYFLKFLEKNQRIKVLSCKRVHRSYNKYLPILSKFPDRGFITCDDDIVYPFDFVESLLSRSKHVGDRHVIVNRYHRKTYIDGKLNLYKNWEFNSRNRYVSDAHDIFLTTGGGVFFPAGSLRSSDFDFAVIKSYFYTVDDVFINKLLDLRRIKKELTSKYINLVEMYDPRINGLNLNIENTTNNDRAMSIEIQDLITIEHNAS